MTLQQLGGAHPNRLCVAHVPQPTFWRSSHCCERVTLCALDWIGAVRSKNISCKTGKFAGYGFDFADDQCGTIDTRTCVASSDRPDRWVLRGYAPGLAPGFTRLLEEGGVRGLYAGLWVPYSTFFECIFVCPRATNCHM